MELSYNRLIKVKIALSNVTNDSLAEHIGVNKSSLSRNESKHFYHKVSQYFDKEDPEINEAVDLIIEHFDFYLDDVIKQLQVNDAISVYETDIEKKYKAEIRQLKKDLVTYEKIEKVLYSQLIDKEKIITRLERDLSECDIELENLKNKLK